MEQEKGWNPDITESGWKALFNFTMKHMDPQGDPTKSAFEGKTKEQVQEEIEFLNKIFTERSVNVGEKLKKIVSEICEKNEKKEPKLNKGIMMAKIFEVEDLVENVDFADMLFKIDGVKLIMNGIVKDDQFPWEDVKVYAMKIIGQCLYNSNLITNSSDMEDLYNLTIQKIKFHKNNKNMDFLTNLLFILTSFITSKSYYNTIDKNKKDVKTSDLKTNAEVFSDKFCENEDQINLVVSLLLSHDDFNVIQKVFHLFISIFILDESLNKRSLLSKKFIKNQINSNQDSSSSSIIFIICNKILKIFETLMNYDNNKNDKNEKNDDKNDKNDKNDDKNIQNDQFFNKNFVLIERGIQVLLELIKKSNKRSKIHSKILKFLTFDLKFKETFLGKYQKNLKSLQEKYPSKVELMSETLKNLNQIESFF